LKSGDEAALPPLTLWLDNDDVVRDELPDGSPRVGIGDNAGVERVHKDAALAYIGNGGREPLLEAQTECTVSGFHLLPSGPAFAVCLGVLQDRVRLHDG